MPSKRKDCLISKQKRLIATRLMQISLLVDDYLYQQKPMSQKSAAAYISEISGYKDKCYQDVRSLQVIEKLTRCMKGIIHEQQELQGEYAVEDNFVVPFQDVLNTNTNAMLSPVYSTADEDLTQYLEIDDNMKLGEEVHDTGTDSNINKDKHRIETKEGKLVIDPCTTKESRTKLMKNVTENFNKAEKDPLINDIEIIDLFDVEIDEPRTKLKKNVTENFNKAEKDPLINDMEVIDLCDVEIDELNSLNNAFRFENEPDFNIQNAISNLSIRDIEEAFTPFSQNCSQSILDDYHPAYNNSGIRKDEGIRLTTNHDVIRTVTNPRQKSATELKSKGILPKIVLPTTKQKMPGNKLVAVSNINRDIAQNAPVDTETVKAYKPLTKKQNNAKNKKNIKSSKQSVTNAVMINKDTAKDVNTKKKNKQNYVKANDTKPNEPIRNTNTTQKQNLRQYTSNTKKQLTYSKTRPSIDPPADKIYLKAHNKGKDSQMVPIYKSVVVNDLSWIENIRFVREIPSEEYESFTEGKDFWENFTLPVHWNEDDFNYQ